MNQLLKSTCCSVIMRVSLLLTLLVLTCQAKKGDTFVVPPKGTISIYHTHNPSDVKPRTKPDAEITTQASAFAMSYVVNTIIKGIVVPAIPPGNGCKENPHPNGTKPEGIDWILILDDLDCSIDAKTRLARGSGFKAVIIVNSHDNEDEKTYGVTSDGKELIEHVLPVFSISAANGKLLKENLTWNSMYFVKIHTPMSWYQIFLLIVIWGGLGSIVGIFLFAFLKPIFGRTISPLYRRIKISWRRTHLERCVNKIPTEEWKKSQEIPSHYETCAICLEDFKNGDEIRVLKCSHRFHKACVDTWFFIGAKTYCPMCKDNLKGTKSKASAVAVIPQIV